MKPPYALLFGGQLGAGARLGGRLAGSPAFRPWLAAREAAGTSDAASLLLDPECPAASDRFAAARLMVLYGAAAATACIERLGAPVVMAGYSLGFYPAAATAGVAPLELFLEWVERVNASNAALFPPGLLATGVSVGLSRSDLESRFSASGLNGLYVSAVNNRTQIVFAGPANQVARALESLAGVALDARALPLDVPLHSPHLAPSARAVASWWATVPLRDPAVPLLSPLDGSLIRDAESFRRHMLASLSAPTDWAAVVKALKVQAAPGAVDLSPQGDLGRMTRWGWRELQITGLEKALASKGEGESVKCEG